MSSNISNKERNKAIDGWRFLFALLIIWHHLPWVDGTLHELGYCPVSFFFIISGWLSLYSDTSNLKEYYCHKFFKIFPIYWFALVFSLIETIPIRSFWTPTCPMVILQHIFLLQAYYTFPQAYYLNPPMWFLCVLVLFYALLPLLRKWISNNPKSFTAGVLIYSILVVVITWVFFEGDYAIRVNMPFVRICECLIGMVTAYWLRDIKLPSWINYIAVAVLASFFLFAGNLPIEYIRPYLSIPVMLLLIVSCMKSTQNRSLLIYFNKWGG